MRRRLLLSYLSVTVFVLLVLEIPLGIAYAHSERRRLTTGVQHDALALSIRAEDPLERGDPAALQRLARGYRHGVGGRVVIVDAHGRLLADSDPRKGEEPDFADRPEVAAALRGTERTGTRYSQTLGTSLLYVAVPVSSNGVVRGAVRVTYPTSFVDSRVRRNWLVLGLVGAVILVVVFAVSLVLARSVSRPLRDLEAAADRFGHGDLEARARVPAGPAELRVLSESFNRTAARLEQLVRAQQAFVADASHQLRSPLAALRLRLENLEDELSEPADARDDVAGALDEVSRLSRLVDGLLALAHEEQAQSAPAPVALDEIVEGRRAAWAALAAERGVELEVHGPAASVLATPGRLEQLLDNVLNNALDVAPPGTAVQIVTEPEGDRPQGDRVVLRVEDEGPGMTPDQRTRAFDRFWRGAAAGAGRGSGLGLAIVRELVTADGGDVRLEEAPSGGLAVVLRLVRARGRR